MADVRATAESHLHGRVTSIIQRLRKLDSRLSEVTSNICGTAPEPDKGSTQKPIDEHVHEKLNDVDNLLYSMEQEMARLESSVGSRHALQPAGKAVAAGY